MQFLNPLALGFAAIIPIIILLYLLKPRRQEMVIPSTYLWEQVLKDIEASTPWQRLKKNLLLLLQLLAAALLVMALTRPYLPVAENTARHLVVVVDCSASMAAADVSPSRFEEARRQAAKLADELGPYDRMTLIAMAETPAVIVSASQESNEIKRQLHEMSLRPGQADLKPVMEIVAAMLKNDKSISLLILTDGGVLAQEEETVMACPVTVNLIGNSSDNAAITTLAMRKHNDRIITLARIQNFSGQTTKSELELRADDILLDIRSLELEPGAIQDIIWEELPLAADIIEARLLRKDILAEDNQAWAVVQETDSKKALLVTSGNIFLEKALSLTGSLELYKMAPDGFLNYEDDYDLYVFDGWLPPSMPKAASFIINPPPGNGVIDVSGSGGMIDSISRRPDEPLLRYVDVNGWQIATAAHITAPPGFKSLLESGERPLLMTGELQGYRSAVWTFDLHDSNIPLQTGFPILINNLLGWLLPAGQEASTLITADEYGFTVPPECSEIIMRGPDGEERSYQPPFPAAYPTVQPGPYRFTQVTEDGSQIILAVKNFGNPLESNLEPRPLEWLQSGDQAGDNITNRELWSLLIIFCLLTLLVEWEVYRRGY